MFEIIEEPGCLKLAGRLDAAQSIGAEAAFEAIGTSAVVDMSALEYISSAGLGLLLKTHKRLMGQGAGLKLVNVNPHIADILHYSGFDRLFDVSPPR
jgi:anti-anti-sigma factor